MNNSHDNHPGVSRFGPADYIKITVLGFALTALWSSLQGVVIPIRLLDFVREEQKNTYLGLLTFAGLIVAMLTQPAAGAVSDRTHFRWGKRRPYIVLGGAIAIVLLPGIGWVDTYLALFGVFCLLQFATNISQGAYQAFIPDLVPETKWGLASGVKGLMEILGGVVLLRLVAFLMARYFEGKGESWLWLALLSIGVVIFAATLATAIFVKEKQGKGFKKIPLSTIHRSFRLKWKDNHDFILFLISRGLMGMPGVMLQVFALYYLSDVVGMENPAEAAANLLIVVGICLLVTVYPAGRLSDKIGRRPIFFSSGIIGAVAVVLLYFARSNIEILVAGGFMGVANGAMLSSSWALATDLALVGEKARYLGLTNLAMAGGSALARLVGPIIDVFNNITFGLGYRVMLYICITCFVIGSIVVVRIRQPRSLQENQP